MMLHPELTSLLREQLIRREVRKYQKRIKFNRDQYPYPKDHPEAKGFIDSITADPGDETRRLVYSDWLEENGYQDHAEAIRHDATHGSEVGGCP